MTLDQPLRRHGLSSLGRTFRGGIADNAKRFKLIGGAYASMPQEQAGIFDIKSAQQLRGVLAALIDPNVREVILIGAVQVLKSIAGDLLTAYVIEHIRRNMLILFEDDPKARLYADTRVMQMINGHEGIKAMFIGADRHDATKTLLKFPNHTVKIGGMNDGNCSSLSWPIIWISEGYQHKSDGLLDKAVRRADRYPDDCKIFIESRAGFVGEDLHARASSAHLVNLTWACPHCGGRQTWDFTQRRDDGSFAGMTFDDGDSIAQRAATARWECLHCRQPIHDTKETRQKIADTYQQDYKINGVSPKRVCFYLPKEAATGNSFEKSVTSYLTAKEAMQSGNTVKMQDWFMEDRATFYESRLSQPTIITIASGYDPHTPIPNSDHRGMVIDCQKHLEYDTVGTFWFEVYEADKDGNSFQLERGFVTSWEKLDEIQKKWNVSNQFVGIDGRKWTPTIMDEVAKRRVLARAKIYGRDTLIAITWTILMGDKARSFPWSNKDYRPYAQRTVSYRTITMEGKQERIPVYTVRWSNLSMKDQLYSLRIGGEGKPKFEALKFEQLSPEMQLKETGKFSYDEQMNSETPVVERGQRVWKMVNENNPNHYWDLANMRLTQMARRGLASHSAEA